MTNNQPNPFPVEWEKPEDAQAFWLFDSTHCPTPLSPLDYELRMQPLLEMLNRVSAGWGMPLAVEPKLIHGFVYNKIISHDVSQDAMPGVLQGLDDTVRQRYADLPRTWEQTWLPDIQEQLAALSSFDLRSATWPALIAHLSETKRRITRLWEIHSEIFTPMMLAISDFEEAYQDIFKGAKPLEVHEILGGFPNKTVEGNVRLWALGRQAAKSPSLGRLIMDTTVDRLAAALAETEEGRILLEAIQDYVHTYGERNDDLYIDKPTWIDDPTPVLRGLREAVLQADRDLEAEMQNQAAKREKRLAQLREKLASHPRAVVDEFERLLKLAQTGNVLSEDHHFWIDCKVTHHARRVALEIGHRLMERGVLRQKEDVFRLQLSELTSLGEEFSDEMGARLRALVSQRQEEAVQFAKLQPPPFLGIPRPMLPMDCAVMRLTVKFAGNMYALPAEPGADLVGMPGSSGKVRGTAKIVRTLDETTKLQRGDIMVSPATLPSWTPFFASIAGIVTNTGGMLCHAAVVAREYGIPAVVGTVRATETYKDGQLIEIDGDAGVVRIVSE